MKLFERVKDEVLSKFGTWIKVIDPKSIWTIEDFPYETGVDEKETNPHCWKCVTVNHCWFKNEEGKKPQKFDASQYFLKNISKPLTGIYHPNCHCKENFISTPKIEDIKLIIPEGKIDWFFRDKAGLAKAWGYGNDKK